MSLDKLRALTPANAARAALLAAPLLFGAAGAKAENKPCDQDIVCSAGQGLLHNVSTLAPKSNQADLDRALFYAADDCRADLIQILLAEGANKNSKTVIDRTPLQQAERSSCSDRTKNLLR